MSLSARLHIDGHRKQDKGLSVLECDFELSQKIDPVGRIASNLSGGLINILLDVENDGEILHWMMTNTTKSGKIVFIGAYEGKTVKTIEFKNAFLIRYKEVFNALKSVTISITLSAQKLTIAGEQMENSWDLSTGNVK